VPHIPEGLVQEQSHHLPKGNAFLVVCAVPKLGSIGCVELALGQRGGLGNEVIHRLFGGKDRAVQFQLYRVGRGGFKFVASTAGPAIEGAGIGTGFGARYFRVSFFQFAVDLAAQPAGVLIERCRIVRGEGAHRVLYRGFISYFLLNLSGLNEQYLVDDKVRE
jgi:hypothetical protein